MTDTETFRSRAMELVSALRGSGLSAKFRQASADDATHIVTVFAQPCDEAPIDRVHVGEGGYSWGWKFENHADATKTPNVVAGRIRYTINHEGR